MGARLGRVVTLEEIAGTLGVSAVTVGRWEKNQNAPDLAMIQRLAKLFGVSPGWLAFGEHPIVAPNGSQIDAAEIINPSVDRKLTDEEVDRATRTAAQRRAAKQARKREKGA